MITVCVVWWDRLWNHIKRLLFEEFISNGVYPKPVFCTDNYIGLHRDTIFSCTISYTLFTLWHTSEDPKILTSCSTVLSHPTWDSHNIHFGPLGFSFHLVHNYYLFYPQISIPFFHYHHKSTNRAWYQYWNYWGFICRVRGLAL